MLLVGSQQVVVVENNKRKFFMPVWLVLDLQPRRLFPILESLKFFLVSNSLYFWLYLFIPHDVFAIATLLLPSSASNDIQACDSNLVLDVRIFAASLTAHCIVHRISGNLILMLNLRIENFWLKVLMLELLQLNRWTKP